MHIHRIAITILAHNESASVGSVIRGARAVLPDACVVVVDDGSTDDTARVAEEAGARVLRLPYNAGIGVAAQTGQLYALREGFDVLVRLDGDGQHPPEQIPVLLEGLADGEVDVVVGSRFVEGSSYRAPLARRLGIELFSRLLTLVCRRRFTDVTSGFMAARRPALFHLVGMAAFDYPEVESLMSLHRAGYRIVEVPVDMKPRTTGESSLNPVRSAYFTAKVMLAILVNLMSPPQYPRAQVLARMEGRLSPPERNKT